MEHFNELVKKAEAGVIEKLEKSGFDFSQDLQRTEEWFEQRRGKFTGSKIKELMSCSGSTARMEWGRPEKALDFGDTAKKYVFEKAKERQRNKVIHLPVTSAMRYGTENEDAVIELLKEKMPQYDIDSVGFIEFIPGLAGASPDGKMTDKTEQFVRGLEIKCATGWAGVYNRHEVSIDQSHQDFWQLQSEMLALQVPEIVYVVAEPSESIFEPDITDLSIKFVPESRIHQQAIIDRCLIANKAIQYWFQGDSITEALVKSGSEYEFKD